MMAPAIRHRQNARSGPKTLPPDRRTHLGVCRARPSVIPWRWKPGRSVLVSQAARRSSSRMPPP
jgi:hypothetical protein